MFWHLSDQAFIVKRYLQLTEVKSLTANYVTCTKSEFGQ